MSILVLVGFVALTVSAIASRKAKPLGSLPYRWGLWLALFNAVVAFEVFFSSAILTASGSGHSVPWTSAWISWAEEGALIGLIAGIPFGAIAWGLLRRRRWAVIIYFAAYSIPAIALILLVRNTGAVILATLWHVAFLGPTWAYFRKRWPLLNAPSLTAQTAGHTVGVQ